MPMNTIAAPTMSPEVKAIKTQQQSATKYMPTAWYILPLNVKYAPIIRRIPPTKPGVNTGLPMVKTEPTVHCSLDRNDNLCLLIQK